MWWFANSQDDTQMVLILSIHQATRTILMEVWQQAYCIKELIITLMTVIGAFLTLLFQEIFDHPPMRNVQGIVLDAAALMSIARPL